MMPRIIGCSIAIVDRPTTEKISHQTRTEPNSLTRRIHCIVELNRFRVLRLWVRHQLQIDPTIPIRIVIKICGRCIQHIRGGAAQSMMLAGSMVCAASAHFTHNDVPVVLGLTPLNSQLSFEYMFKDAFSATCPRTDTEVRIFSSAKASMDSCVEGVAEMDGPTNETGGVLFGFRDSYLNITWIVEASPPPPDSNATPTSFVCGVEGVAERLSQWAQDTDGLVEFLGTWHSHPVSAANPSSTDYDAV